MRGLRLATVVVVPSSENERDDSQNDEYDDEPFGDLHAEAGNPAGTENPRNDREYQKQDREFDEPSSELQGSQLCWCRHIGGCLTEYHTVSPQEGVIITTA